VVRADVAAHVLAVAAGDPSANRIVYGAVIALVVIGVILLGVAVWLFRQTRVDPELLAPLERMADRSWSKLDPATQRRMLDEVRPAGALPLHREPSAPVPDEEFDKPLRPVSSYEDLKDPEPDAVGGDDEPEPAAVEAADGGGDDPEVDEAALDDSTETSGQAEPATDAGTDTSDDAEPSTDEATATSDQAERASDEPGDGVETPEAGAEAAGVDEPDDVVETPDDDVATGEASTDDDEAVDGEASDEGQPNSTWPAPEDAGARPT
jgi:hypothetical protein